MKKFLIILLVCLVTLSACTPSESNPTNNYSYVTDMQYYNCDSGNGRLPYTESPEGYYVSTAHGLLIFIDKQTHRATPLCNQADCLHDDPDTCKAYSYGNVQYYDGALYDNVIEYDSSGFNPSVVFRKIRPDGSDVTRLGKGLDCNVMDWFINRGIVFYSNESGIYSIPLTDWSSESTCLISIKDVVPESVNYDKFVAYENYVYVVYSAISTDNKTVIRSYAYNIESGEIKEILSDNESIAAFRDGMLFTAAYGQNSVTYSRSNLDGSNKTEIKTFPTPARLLSDGKRLLLSTAKISDDVCEHSETIAVLDDDLNQTGSFVLTHCTPGDFCAQSADGFIMIDTDDSGEAYLYYADKQDIENGKELSSVKLCPCNWVNNDKLKSDMADDGIIG